MRGKAAPKLFASEVCEMSLVGADKRDGKRELADLMASVPISEFREPCPRRSPTD
jgi:hypothetical protein